MPEHSHVMQRTREKGPAPHSVAKGLESNGYGRPAAHVQDRPTAHQLISRSRPLRPASVASRTGKRSKPKIRLIPVLRKPVSGPIRGYVQELRQT